MGHPIPSNLEDHEERPESPRVDEINVTDIDDIGHHINWGQLNLTAAEDLSTGKYFMVLWAHMS